MNRLRRSNTNSLGLIDAAQNGDVARVKAKLKAGKDVNSKDEVRSRSRAAQPSSTRARSQPACAPQSASVWRAGTASRGACGGDELRRLPEPYAALHSLSNWSTRSRPPHPFHATRLLCAVGPDAAAVGCVPGSPGGGADACGFWRRSFSHRQGALWGYVGVRKA